MRRLFAMQLDRNLKLPNRRIRDATHTNSLQKMYTNGIIKLFDRFDEQLRPGLLRMLNRNKENNNIDYAENPGFNREFNDKINTISDITIYAGMPTIVDKHITQSYKIGKTRATQNPRITRSSIRIDPSLSYYDMRIIEDLKYRNLGLVTKMTEDMKSNLLQIMLDDIKMGKGTTDIIKDISNSISDISKSRAKTIARTEIAYSYNTAVGETFKQVGINQWQWLATLGVTCCDECRSNHGQVFDWSDEQPPLHPNCFCTMYPVIEGIEKGI